MSKFNSYCRKFAGKVLFLCGLMDGEKKRKGLSSFSANTILMKTDNLMKSEKLFTSSELTITQLARKTGTNRTYLSKCFRMNNTNYVDYVNDYRVVYAKSLFEDERGGRKSITEISELSGFPNPRSFSKCFSNKYGKTPSQFKRELLAKFTPPRF